MSRHDGVSCDACLKSSFRGRRFKCLRCYDYDLCGTCFDSCMTTTRHTADHPMQCILTRVDQEVYFGGDPTVLVSGNGTDYAVCSFTCPLCGQCGFTDVALTRHCLSEHAEQAGSVNVICPVCASLPQGEPNNQTQDLAGHLQYEHRAGAAVLEHGAAPGVVELPPVVGAVAAAGTSSASQLRTLRQTARRSGAAACRSAGASLTATGVRHSMRGAAAAAGGGSGSVASAAAAPASSWASSDPIAELLTQLSNVRSRGNMHNQLAQLEQQVQVTRAQLERLPISRHDGRSGGERRSLSSAAAAAAAAAGGLPSAAALAAVAAGVGGGAGFSQEKAEAIAATAALSGAGSRLASSFLLAAGAAAAAGDALEGGGGGGALRERGGVDVVADADESRGLLGSLTASDEEEDAADALLKTAFVRDLLLATLCQPLA